MKVRERRESSKRRQDKGAARCPVLPAGAYQSCPSVPSLSFSFSYPTLSYHTSPRPRLLSAVMNGRRVGEEYTGKSKEEDTPVPCHNK